MLSRVEIKCVAKHLLKCSAWSVHLLLNPATGEGWGRQQMYRHTRIFPTKCSRDLLKFRSQIIQKRTMSCTLNFIWMRHPGTENSLLCLENLIHREVSISPFAHHCSIWAVGTLIFHFWIVSRMKAKCSIKPHKRLWIWYVRLWCKGRVSRKSARNFPVGFF